MAIQTLADAEQEVWDNCGDFDPLNRTLDQVTLDRLLNRCYAWVRGLEDDRIYTISGSVSGAGGFSANQTSKLLSETSYRRILQVYPAANNVSLVSVGRELSRWTQSDLIGMQIEDATQAPIGSSYAVWRAGTATAASVGKYNFGVWRLPDGTPTYYVLNVLKFVTALAAASDKFDCSEDEHHLIVDMASEVGSRWIGRSEEWIAQITKRIPDRAQAASRNIAAEIGLI